MYNILICDDDADIRAALRLYLAPEGYGIFEAADGAEALALLGREAILVRKHTKKGDKDFDIKPDFADIQVQTQENGLLLQLRLPCSMNGSTNPALLLEALKQYEGEEPFSTITRKRLLLKDFSELR